MSPKLFGFILFSKKTFEFLIIFFVKRYRRTKTSSEPYGRTRTRDAQIDYGCKRWTTAVPKWSSFLKEQTHLIGTVACYLDHQEYIRGLWRGLRLRSQLSVYASYSLFWRLSGKSPFFSHWFKLKFNKMNLIEPNNR